MHPSRTACGTSGLAGNIGVMNVAISAEQWVVGFVAIAIAAALVAPVAAGYSAWLAMVVLAICLAALPWAASRLPTRLTGARQRHPVLAAAWLGLGLVAVIQVGRLSAFMVDSSRVWGSTIPDAVAAGHQCLAAYVYAADLSRRGEKNVYDERWYPAFTRQPFSRPAGVSSHVEGLDRWVEDPYEYPPPFLLLPRAALAMTSSFERIRTMWFLIQSVCFAAGGILLARWIGGREGLVVGLLLPAILASAPTMLNLQFGQFHTMAVMLAVAAMVAFDSRRRPLGGTLLSFAILSKIFPGLLLITLAGQRRWREIGWTLGLGLGFVLLALFVLGTDPFVAFVSYQLPRIVSGEAFSFAERADTPVFIVSRNFSVHAIVAKLHLLGVPRVGPAAADALTWSYTALLLWLAWRIRLVRNERRIQAMVWLALLNLAALRSPVAPSAYATAPLLWLLALLAAEIEGRYSMGTALAVAWVVIMGAPPLSDKIDLVVGLAGQILMLALGIWILLRTQSTPAPAVTPEPLAG